MANQSSIFPMCPLWLKPLSFQQKIRPLRGMEQPVLAKSSGEEGKLVYRDGPDGAFVAAAGVADAVVLVIRRTSTRRFLARPSLVLFDSTGLSFARPVKANFWA